MTSAAGHPVLPFLRNGTEIIALPPASLGHANRKAGNCHGTIIFVIPYYPVWSLIDIAIAVMVIYGLSAHFGDREASPSRPEKAHQHG